jgi:hypothetical protein
MATKRIEFGESISELDRLIGFAEEIGNLDQQDYIDAFKVGVPEAQKMAGQFLSANLASSGVKSNTGDLAKAVGNPAMSVVASKDGVYVHVQPDPKNTNRMFTILSSVNYGRVNSEAFDETTVRRQRAIGGGFETVKVKNVGDKNRRNLKNKLQNLGSKQGIVKAGRGLSFGTGSLGKTRAGSTTVETSRGRATVTKAFDYYKISPSQSRQILGVLFRGAAEHLKSKIKKSLRR